MKSDILRGMTNRKANRMMTIQQFRQHFGEEEQCWKHLTHWRWPRGFVCSRCGGGSRGYMKAKRVHECRVCGYQGSVTAGTIFHKTRVPLRDWLWAIYRMSQGKKGISAVQLSKEIGVGYPTAWLMQHKIRQAMAEGEQATRLRGLVEVDEGYVGGAEKGRGRGGRGAQTKSMVAVAVEHRGAGKAGRRPRPGRSALAVMRDGTAGECPGLCAQPNSAPQHRVDRCLVELPGANDARLPACGHPLGQGPGGGGALLSLGAYHPVQPQEVLTGDPP